MATITPPRTQGSPVFFLTSLATQNPLYPCSQRQRKDQASYSGGENGKTVPCRQMPASLCFLVLSLPL